MTGTRNIEFKVGDKAFTERGSAIRTATVQRLTATQVILMDAQGNEIRVKRADGVEINKYHSYQWSVTTDEAVAQMAAEQARQAAEKQAQRDAKAQAYEAELRAIREQCGDFSGFTSTMDTANNLEVLTGSFVYKGITFHGMIVIDWNGQARFTTTEYEVRVALHYRSGDYMDSHNPHEYFENPREGWKWFIARTMRSWH